MSGRLETNLLKLIVHVQVVVSLGIFLQLVNLICAEELQKQSGQKEYCQSEIFNPKCLKHEAILMKSATYGRMRIGKCITSEEVAELGPLVERDPRFFGCSRDVLSVLHEKCSAMSECEVRIEDSFGKMKPCFTGLYAYLEAEYECVNVADEERSCVVTLVSNNPSFLIGSSSSKELCGTQSQPWIIEAPVGQKLQFTLFDFSIPLSESSRSQYMTQCQSYGTIVDKTNKRNASICRAETKQEKVLFLTNGNSASVYFAKMLPNEDENHDELWKILLKVQVVGCSDIIPPEDTWLKRDADLITIGCYSTRQTWRLSCKEGKWVGVLGNCSKDISLEESVIGMTSKEETAVLSENGQVLAMVSIVGFTVAICLIIACIGVVCLRRYAAISRKKDYSTLNYHLSAARSQLLQPTDAVVASQEANGLQSIPTYSVFVGQGDYNTASHKFTIDKTDG